MSTPQPAVNIGQIAGQDVISDQTVQMQLLHAINLLVGEVRALRWQLGDVFEACDDGDEQFASESTDVMEQ